MLYCFLSITNGARSFVENFKGGGEKLIYIPEGVF